MSSVRKNTPDTSSMGVSTRDDEVSSVRKNTPDTSSIGVSTRDDEVSEDTGMTK